MNQKLPLLYLLDSIMKNLRAKYLEIINTKVVAIFCHCFEKLVRTIGVGGTTTVVWVST